MARTRSVSEDIIKDVKRANQRLRELEKQGLANESKAYQYIMKKANKNLAGDSKVKMFSITRSGQIKFRTDLAKLKQENRNVYRAMLKNLEGFLEAKTSTKIGIEDAHKKSFKKFKEYGYKGNFNEWSDMWNNYAFEQLVKKFGVSDTVSIADNIVNEFHISYDDAFKGMLESGASSEYGLKEYFKEKYNINNEDYEDIE